MIRFTHPHTKFVLHTRQGLSLLLAGGLTILSSGCILVSNTSERWAGAGGTTASLDFKDPVLNERKVVITSDLNDQTARNTILQLQYLDSHGTGPIDLYVDTDGGPAENAFAIIDVLRSLRSPVNTWAMGNCNSGGAMILVAGTGRRFAFPNAVIAIHGGKKVGHVPQDYMRIVNQQIESLWKQRAHLPPDWFPLRGDLMHFLSSSKALEYGVIDEIAKPQKPAVSDKAEGSK